MISNFQFPISDLDSELAPLLGGDSGSCKNRKKFFRFLSQRGDLLLFRRIPPNRFVAIRQSMIWSLAPMILPLGSIAITEWVYSQSDPTHHSSFLSIVSGVAFYYSIAYLSIGGSAILLSWWKMRKARNRELEAYEF